MEKKIWSIVNYIITHAKRQQKRGRRPSAIFPAIGNFSGIKNPKKALDYAKLVEEQTFAMVM